MINVFLNRIFRAIKIDIELFEEVEKDKKATFQAGAVVVLSSFGRWCRVYSLQEPLIFLVAPALSLLSWYVWAYVIYFVGVKLFRDPKTKSNHGELLRTIGFSSAPGLIRVFGVTPELMTVTFCWLSLFGCWHVWLQLLKRLQTTKVFGKLLVLSQFHGCFKLSSCSQ